MNDFCFADSSTISKHQSDCDFLADVIGMLVGKSKPKEGIVEGKLCMSMILELLEASGRIRCLVAEDCTSRLEQALSDCNVDRPVILFRFAKIRMYLGFPYVQNVKEISQIFVDPEISQVTEFKRQMSIRGVPAYGPIDAIVPKMKEYGAAEFLLFYPKKAISELESIIEDGRFVISGVLVGFIDCEDWWFPSLSINDAEIDASSLTTDCDSNDYELHLISSFRAKFNVFDDTGEAVFVLFDDDLRELLKENCSYLVTEMESLFGKNFLFLVDKESTSNPTSDCCYRVLRVCHNPEIINLFNGKNARLDLDFFPHGGCECNLRGR